MGRMKTQILLTSDSLCEIIAAESGSDGESGTTLPTINIVGYTGVPLRQPAYKYPVVVDLAGMTVDPTRTPILINHDENRIVGHTVGIQNDGKTLKLSGVLSGPSSTTADLVEMSKNNYPWQSSIGASIGQLELVGPRESVTVNGREFAGPVYIARSSALREISLTPTGVDKSTEASIAAMDTPHEKGSPMSFQDWLVSVGVDANNATPEQLASLEQAYKAVVGEQAEDAAEASADPAPTAASYVSDLRASAVAENKRIASISTICVRHPDIAAKAISEGWTPEKAELNVLRASRPAAPAIHSGFGTSDLNGDAIVAALVSQSSKISNKSEFLNQEFDDRTLEASNSRIVRQISRQGFTGLCGVVLAAAGKHVPTGRITSEMFRDAVHADGELRASGFSEMSLGVILSNYANKILLASFTNVQSAYREIAATTSLNDFKNHLRARMTTSGIMEKVSPDGEIRHEKASEESWSIKADTYAKMLSVDRQSILNDDLGAFDQIPADMGRKAALALEKAGIGLLIANATGANGNAFYSTGNKNYLSGGTSVLGIDSVTAAEALFNSQTDFAGNPIALTPAIMLVPPALKVAAEQIYNDRFVVGPTTAKTLNGNPHAGKFRPVYSPFLTSATGFYLFADPSDQPAAAVGYVNGQTTPIVEQVQLDAYQLGIGIRGIFDFGVGLVDYRASVASAGA